MEDFKVLKLFLFSIVNLLTYLLSIYFITSMYFTKSIEFYFKNFKDLPFNSQYKQVSISFGFHTLSFLCYFVSLFIIIYKSDISSKSTNENSEIDKEVIINEKSKFDIFIDYALLVLFSICQIFYLLNLILISVDLRFIKKINFDCILDRDKFIIGIYQELLIVGYIFFFILFLISIWTLLITEQKYNCFPYIKKKFKSFENYLTIKIEDTPKKLENKNQILDKALKSLKQTNNENCDSSSEIVQMTHQNKFFK